jgi:predicted DCC family thiol-disulfide oxidoreductase YuxK
MREAPSPPEAGPEPVVLFDGVCNLCNASVDFLLRRDASARFRFAPLQSAFAARLLAEHGLAGETLASIVLIEGGRAFTRSEAALRIAALLPGPWPVLGVLRAVPRRLRDTAYDLLARRRYRWFGRRPACRTPTPEERARFLG